MKASTYLQKAWDYKDSRWAAIKLSKDADTVPAEDIPWLLVQLRAQAIRKTQETLDYMKGLNAPPVILQLKEKALAQAKRGGHPTEAALRRSANRRNIPLT